MIPIKKYPAKVIEIINPKTLIINIGTKHNTKLNQSVLLYCHTKEEIIDPLNGKSIGYLEAFKGTGRISKIELEKSEIKGELPFDNPKIGDLVKPF